MFAEIISYAAAMTGSMPPIYPRPSSWALPIIRPGLPNFFIVSPVLYRSANPSSVGIHMARELCVSKIVNLRRQSDSTPADITRVHIPMKAWAPKDGQVMEFLQQVAGADVQHRVLVHCQHGADRTGLMIAMYRIVMQGWTKQDAINEMVFGGFGFHPIWSGLVHFIVDADVNEYARCLT